MSDRKHKTDEKEYNIMPGGGRRRVTSHRPLPSRAGVMVTI